MRIRNNLSFSVSRAAGSLLSAQALNETLYSDRLPDPSREIIIQSIFHPDYDHVENIDFHRSCLQTDRERTAPCDFGDYEIFFERRLRAVQRLDAEDTYDRGRLRNVLCQYWDHLFVAHFDYQDILHIYYLIWI